MRKPRAKKPLYLYPANIVFKALSHIGMSLGAINVLTVAGRVSGRPHSTPVSPVLLNGRRFVIAPMPQADWACNARASGRGRLTNGRRTKPVILRELGDPDLRRAVMTAFPAAVPHGVRLFKALGLVNGADPDQFAAAADHVTAFEVLPSPAPRRTPYSSAPS